MRPARNNRRCWVRSVAILLNARGAQACEAMAVDRRLPGQELFDRERVTLAGLFQAQQATANSRDNLCLPADHPAPRIRRRKVRDSQGAAIGADDIFHSGTYHFGHWTLYTTQDHERHSSLPHLKIA
ncbi:hypothetical protein RHECNPAF_3500052 [Rhizobium etli CNPAF512]|nr:hypothetical protein RHECNPAF_3500052 [Rhizobium etli CNPAF512]